MSNYSRKRLRMDLRRAPRRQLSEVHGFCACTRGRYQSCQPGNQYARHKSQCHFSTSKIKLYGWLQHLSK
ncbi:hypothetical protein LYZ76_19785 [Xanthomonas campestris pv. coriandri]|nr:hypothetical protein [Xanthomonas campestris pv. coriandri]